MCVLSFTCHIRLEEKLITFIQALGRRENSLIVSHEQKISNPATVLPSYCVALLKIISKGKSLLAH